VSHKWAKINGLNRLDLNEESKAMKYHIFKILSMANKALLPKLYKKPDLTKLSKAEMAIAGWKRWVTFRYFEARDARPKK
jgi:hypothetical protein